MTQLDSFSPQHPADTRDEPPRDVVDIVRGLLIVSALALAVWASAVGLAYAVAEVVLAVTD